MWVHRPTPPFSTPIQAEYDAAKAKWEEEKKLSKATPSKDAAKERRQSEIASE